MKPLEEYIFDTHKQYVYRIKLAGELPEGAMEKFKRSLEKFDLVNSSELKKTPIQSDPQGFPGLKNQEISIFDVTFNYPAAVDQIREMAKRSGFDEAKLVVLSKDFNDSMNAELEHAEQNKDLLSKTDYPEQTKDQKKLSDAYASSFKDAASEFANSGGAEFEVAGGKTSPAKYNTDYEAGKDSPMSKINRASIKDIMK